MKLVHLNETYSDANIRKHFLAALSIHIGLKQDALSPLLFNSALENVIRNVQEDKRGVGI
jgi:hypothetical protein